MVKLIFLVYILPNHEVEQRSVYTVDFVMNHICLFVIYSCNHLHSFVALATTRRVDFNKRTVTTHFYS